MAAGRLHLAEFADCSLASDELLAQQEIAEIHLSVTGENIRDDRSLRSSQREKGRVYIKQRLVGVKRSRSGKSHKQTFTKR